MGLRHRDRSDRATAVPARTRERDALDLDAGGPSSAQTIWAPAAGVYLTDECSLFCVTDARASSGELFLELEDCSTLELIVCPARTVARLGLRAVTPAR